MTDDTREAVSASFRRRKADESFLRDSQDWDVWSYADPEFRNVYDQGVTLHVEQGEATLRFSTGEEVDLQAGDVLTIAEGASVVWDVAQPLRNRYRYE